jgi:hypothetical protein
MDKDRDAAPAQMGGFSPILTSSCHELQQEDTAKAGRQEFLTLSFRRFGAPDLTRQVGFGANRAFRRRAAWGMTRACPKPGFTRRRQ